ncbi:MAG: DUF2029 domain-containing protein [Acidobacteria bacterium]|nr:DUF2029 domain-containing protein [Acidobacteriota bacterium]
MLDLARRGSGGGDLWAALRRAALVYAAANLLLAAVLIALNPEARAADLYLVYSWCRQWLLEGRRLYSLAASPTDYPPHAIVLYAPLALLAWPAIVPVWAAFNAALAPLCALLVARASSVGAAPAATLPAVVLFLCWGGVRMLLQFSRLSMVVAYGALLLVDTRPIASGLLLGCALAKPHISGPIALWMICTRRFKPLLAAAGVVALGFGVYALHVQGSPLLVAGRYWRVLTTLYASPQEYVGRTGLRAWAAAMAPDAAMANAAWLAICAALLVVPWRAAAADGNWRTSRAGAAAPPLFCLWSLLVWFHLGNNLVLLAFPAFAFLLLVRDPPTRWPRRAVAAVMQAALMLDLPVNLRWLVPHLGAAGALVVHADRLVVIGAFAYLALLQRRLLSADAIRTPASD